MQLNDNPLEVANLGKFYTFKNDLISNKLKNERCWEPWMEEVFMKYVKPESTVIEGGCYIGTHTVRLAGLCNPGKLYAFECNPFSFHTLARNLDLNMVPNVVPFKLGLSDKSGRGYVTWIWTSESYPSSDINNYGCTGLDIVEEFAKPEGMNSLQQKIPVDLVSIDSFELENVGFIKLDVEGMERKVIKGAKNTIEKYKPVITVESWKDNKGTPDEVGSKDSVLEDLEKLGYTVTKIHNCDFLALPPSSSTTR
jgi:FkbM family methyltransferase